MAHRTVKKPLATPDLVVRDLDDETVVYDFSTQRAHCLNESARRVLRLCDGTADPAAIAKRLDVPVELVWVALGELSKAKLLVEAMRPPAEVTRRVARRKVMMAVAIPAVWSLVAPSTAYAASKVTCVPVDSCMGQGSGTCCGASGTAAMSCNALGQCQGTGSTCVGHTCS